MEKQRSEFESDRLESLSETLRSHGWREVALPRLRERAQGVQARLATGRHLTLEEMRELQAEHRVLSLIVGDAYQYLKPEE